MPANDRVDELLERLLTLTNDRKIAWKAAETAPESFEFTTANGDKIVVDSRDDDAQPPYDLLVYSTAGTVIARLEWESTARGMPVPDRSVKLRRLWERAREVASGADEVIARILNDLPPIADEDIPF